MSKLGPIPGSIQQRREAVAANAGAPQSYDKHAHEVTATLSRGSPVPRLYGVECLQISNAAIDLSRLAQGGVPVLDHYRQDSLDSILGKVTEAWISDGAPVGRLKFAQTARGRLAEGMVCRNELSAISIGYRVTEWRISDDDGCVIDPERDRIAWDEESLNFLATRWQLLEASLVGVPADGEASIRSLSVGFNNLENIRARMACRHRMLSRYLRVCCV